MASKSRKVGGSRVRKAATGADVARALGVSSATVSLGLRNDRQVSLRTRNLVQAMAAKLNYRPLAAARTLVDGKTHTVGVMFSQPETLSRLIVVYSHTLDAITKTLLKKDYHLNLAAWFERGPSDEGNGLPRMFRESGVDGVLLIQEPPSELEQLLQSYHLPFVVLDAEPKLGRMSVCVDECRAAEMAVEYLVKLGHRLIPYIPEGDLPKNCPFRPYRGREFARGYARAMSAAGLPAIPGWDELVRNGTGSAQMRLEKYWSKSHLPTALITFDDTDAIGAIGWLKVKGFEVPEDVSVVALHDTGVSGQIIGPAPWLAPRITCTANMQGEMAQMATRSLLGLLDNPDSEQESVVLKPKLVIGESAGPCRESGDNIC